MKRTLWPALLLAALVVLAVGPAQASPGDLDTTFGTGGKVTTSFGSHYDEVDGLALQPDGKIVAGGYVEITSSDSDFGLARYKPDGSLDPSFGTGGKVTTAFGSGYDYVSGIVLQPDGKIVAAGRAIVGGVGEFGLARYNADGSLDTSFGAGGKVTTAIGTYSIARGLALQPDGKTVAVGYTYGANYLFAVARYNADGSLDTSFGTGGVVTTSFGGPDDFAYKVALQPDGKIVVAGDHFDGSRNSFALARYNTNGSLDTSFGIGGKVTTATGPSSDAGRAVELQADGKIVVVGYSYEGANYRFAVARYNPDGSLDTSFGTGGKVTTGFPGSTRATPLSAAIQPNGKIVAAGYAYEGTPARYLFALARYNTNGSLDTSFGAGGTLATAIGAYYDYIVDIALQPDGKIVAGGSSQPTADANDSDFALARYLGDSHTLTVSKRGSGKGTVASAPSGIDCGSACSAQFADATSVTLTATPKSGSVLSSWSGGGCSGKKKACTVAMSAERSVKAEFSRCVVPKVKGKPLAKAKRAIKKAHCSVGRVKKSFSRKVKKGRVSAQKPKPATKRPAGAKVSLTVSKGPRR